MMRGYSLGILALHVLAIALFTKGFLLTRTELPFHSHPSDISLSNCSSPDDSVVVGWTRPAVGRLVILVLDALRFDFVAPSHFFPEKKPWMDRLPTLLGRPGSRIFKAVADPPTTSLQRLKGLTTGALPTFIDVGNSFGAPAILEDNFVLQLAKTGKRVVMMGDDTWLQLFPNHFNRSYPFPSFNVKDLHTVDNGCIEHLFPSLYQDDWDVLIAHFLGVDHIGHIFGVDSVPMVEKLEQYNLMLEKVINVLESESGPGGLHQDTFLVVMGDHGQTLNGDHGGGSDEEVETSMFAMSFNKPPSFVPSEFDTSSCRLSLDGEKTCTSTIQQLDFAVTVSALLGVPFPFGSIGHVNPELYALAAGTWNVDSNSSGDHKSRSMLGDWVGNYANVLCINAWQAADMALPHLIESNQIFWVLITASLTLRWICSVAMVSGCHQVKKYIDVYSASSIIGFSAEDLLHLSELYHQAEESWAHIKASIPCRNETCDSLLPVLTSQIDAYLSFLSAVVELARSKWTEFNLKLMGIGLGIMFLSLLFILLSMQKVIKLLIVSGHGRFGFSFELGVAIMIVAIRACSFLSNSYILEEGKVASFLLATSGIFKLRHSIITDKKFSEAILFLLVNLILRFAIEVGLSKQATTSLFMSVSSSWTLGITSGHPFWTFCSQLGPILALLFVAWWLYQFISPCTRGAWDYIVFLALLSYLLIVVHWISESSADTTTLFQSIGKTYIPRMIYAIGLFQLFLIAFVSLIGKEKHLNSERNLVMKALALLSTWSPTIILLSGKQGSWVALASLAGGYCIARLGSSEEDGVDGTSGSWAFDPLSVTQWSLLAVCLFFATGHWCAFDGLRYGAAFIGFDEFILVRQAILLAIDTFGFSHILPMIGLPLLLAAAQEGKSVDQTNHRRSLSWQLSLGYMTYGLITTVAVTLTTMCVAIQRRHLMVWGLFAPKFVFDVVGLLLTDTVICVASLFYF